MTGADWPVGQFGQNPKGWFHEMEKMLNTEYGELCSVYRKELTLKQWNF